MQFDLFDILTRSEAPRDPTMPGVVVGARRWPFTTSHPDNWKAPHRGLVLSENDPCAWRRSCLGTDPTQAQINAHLAAIRAKGQEWRSVPVQWDFVSVGCGLCVMWEFRPNVRTYQEDLDHWLRERQAAYEKQVSYAE